MSKLPLHNPDLPKAITATAQDLIALHAASDWLTMAARGSNLSHRMCQEADNHARAIEAFIAKASGK